MRCRKTILILLLSIFSLFVDCCWYDFTSDIWTLDPIYISVNSMEFGEDLAPQMLYINNSGEHSRISFTITASDHWIIPSITEGVVEKNEDQGIEVRINRALLPEGENIGSLSVIIDNNTNEVRTVKVSAIGVNNIVVSPSYINFGSTGDISSISVKSLSGFRDIILNAPNEWIKLSESEFTLSEFDASNNQGEKEITVTCLRSMLSVGEHNTSISAVSGLGEMLFSLPVSVTIPSQDPLTVAIDNYVFTLNKHLYPEGDDVVLELKIKNYKYLKSFELLKDSSLAMADNGNKYSMEASSIQLAPNATGIMNVHIKDVDKSVKSFSRIELAIKDLSELIVFLNIEC